MTRDSTDSTPEQNRFVPATDPLDEVSSRSRKRVLGIFLAIGVVVIAWLYVIFFYRPELLIDELADKTFPRQAEEICAGAMERFEELPFASQAASAPERAAEVEQSNAIFAEMLDDLRRVVPTEPPEAHEAVSEWLDDWSTYLDDRRSYAARLYEDPQARFLETAKGGPNKGITRAITSFAQVNRMDSCATPADLS